MNPIHGGSEPNRKHSKGGSVPVCLRELGDLISSSPALALGLTSLTPLVLRPSYLNWNEITSFPGLQLAYLQTVGLLQPVSQSLVLYNI